MEVRKCAACGSPNIKWMLEITRMEVDLAPNGDLWQHYGPDNQIRVLVFCEAHQPELEALLKLASGAAAE